MAGAFPRTAPLLFDERLTSKLQCQTFWGLWALPCSRAQGIRTHPDLLILLLYRNISQRSNDISGRKRLLEIRMYHLSDKVSDERALTNFTLALMTKILTRFLHYRLFYVKLVVLCLFLVFIITTLNDWRQLQLWSGGVA